MKILIPTIEKRQELRDNLIVVCAYNRKDNNEVVYGIDYSFKSQYPDFIEVEVLSQEETFWHEEDKTIQLYQTNKGAVWTALNMNQLNEYRKENNIITYQEEDGIYFYVNNLLPEHRVLFTTKEDAEGNKLPGFYLEISLNEK
jgi:hypothetical protein